MPPSPPLAGGLPEESEPLLEQLAARRRSNPSAVFARPCRNARTVSTFIVITISESGLAGERARTQLD